ncbi:hypothetical protein, partial [Prevotella sp. AM42-24]|uniref:hypothetical protein n=1 Tax=Prevotella sp. AM42-24 TaxID=2293125 RepID=UPI001F1596E1
KVKKCLQKSGKVKSAYITKKAAKCFDGHGIIAPQLPHSYPTATPQLTFLYLLTLQATQQVGSKRFVV